MEEEEEGEAEEEGKEEPESAQFHLNGRQMRWLEEEGRTERWKERSNRRGGSKSERLTHTHTHTRCNQCLNYKLQQ